MMDNPRDELHDGVDLDAGDGDHPIGSDDPKRRRPFPDPRERLANGDPIDKTELIELLCSDQVDRWLSGERIPAEAYLSLDPTLQRNGEAAFELIYGEYLIRESLGESPKLEEFFWRFPDFAERLRRQLGLHRALSESEPQTEMVGRTEGDEPGDQPAIPVLPGFEILGILGRGGMSVVYLARQVALNRLVALKLIRARFYADPEIAARFRHEAELTPAALAVFQTPRPFGNVRLRARGLSGLPNE